MKTPNAGRLQPAGKPFQRTSKVQSHGTNSPIVFDSSAILAVLLSEPGADKVLPVLAGGYLSTVNLIEVHSRMIALGAEPAPAWERVLDFECQIIPLSEAQARVAAELSTSTRPFGLSLGDRVCLALAFELQATVFTADRIWERVAQNLSPVIEIEIIR
jgi:ribonuclease VapC